MNVYMHTITLFFLRGCVGLFQILAPPNVHPTLKIEAQRRRVQHLVSMHQNEKANKLNNYHKFCAFQRP